MNTTKALVARKLARSAERWRHRREAETLALLTTHAYSYDRYTSGGWQQAIFVLLEQGYTPREVEAIVRSKHARWAADQAPYRYGHVPGRVLVEYIEKLRDDISGRWLDIDLPALVAGTFGTTPNEVAPYIEDSMEGPE